MNILLFADAFPPFQSSASIQLKDLVDQFIDNGHSVTVYTTSPIAKNYIESTHKSNLKVIRIKNPKTKNVNLIRRAIAESLIPFSTLLTFFLNNKKDFKWDGIIWYSPTIFFGLPIYFIKKYTKSKAYLILRDIFPAWALDIGHIKKGIVYYYFRFFESIQYSVADTIGVQSESNIQYFVKEYPKQLKKVEVLNNWLSKMQFNDCSINISNSYLRNRFNFIYAGNMGSAQKLESIINFAYEIRDDKDIGFIFVGEGDDKKNLEDIAKSRELDNILFYEPIPHTEIRSLYEQCNMGIISLDPNHKTHNIPGKLLSYIQNGLPIFAIVNSGNDILEINRKYNIGIATTENDSKKLKNIFYKYYDNLKNDPNIKKRCNELSINQFSDMQAYNKIIKLF